MEKIIKEVSRTSVNGAIINRKFSPAVFRNETMKKINLQCHIVTPQDVAARYKSNGITADIFPKGEIALIQYAFTGKDMSKEVMKFFNDVCGEDLGHRFEIPNEDYLVLGEVPFSTRGGHPEPYTGIAIPLDGKINVSDDTIKQATKTRALGDFSNERKRIEQIFVSSFNKLRSPTEKSYHLMAYSKNNVKTKDKAVVFFACDKVPLNDTLVKEDITKIINVILSDNTQIREIYKNSAITSDDISRYGDVETKNGPMTIFYIFMNLSGSAVDIDEAEETNIPLRNIEIDPDKYEQLCQIVTKKLQSNYDKEAFFEDDHVTFPYVENDNEIEHLNKVLSEFGLCVNTNEDDLYDLHHSGKLVDPDAVDVEVNVCDKAKLESVLDTLNEEEQPTSKRIIVGQLIEKINEAIGRGKLKEDNEVKLMFNGNYYPVSATNYDKTHGEFYLFFERESTEYMTIAELLQDISSSEAENINAVMGSLNAEYEDYISEVKPTTDDSKPILGLELGDWKDGDNDMR